MTIADDRVDARQLGNLLRCALGVTSSDQDAGGRVFAIDSPQESAGGAVRLGGHAAGVGDDHVGTAGVCGGGGDAGTQLGAYDFAVRPAGPASEVLDVIFCHVASLLNEWTPAQRKANSGRIR